MTLSTTTNVATSTGNGVTLAFSVPFLFYANSDIVVTVDGVEQVLDTDYTLTGAGVDAGGTVTFASAPANGTSVVRTRVVPYTQETDFENFDGNPADVTEKQFDLCVMQTQQLVESVERSLHYPIGDIASAELPTLANRASKYLAFDADGEPIATAGTDSSVPISTFMATVVDDTSAAEARATLGIRHITPFDFGAVGDGVTDDTAAFTAAFASGNDIFIPKGTFLVKSGFTLSTAGQRIFGAGYQSIIQQGGTPSFDIFTVAADNVQIESLRFNGAQTVASTTVYWAIVTDATANPKYVKILNCKFSGSGSTVGFRGAIKYNSSSDYGIVANCDFERLWGSSIDSGYGILSGDVTGLHVVNCRGIGTSGRGRHLIYFSDGASYCVAAYNYIEGFGEAGISQFSQGAQPICESNLYIGNSLVGCQTNGTSTASSIQISGHSRHAKIINNSISGSGRNGISVYNFLYSDCYDTIVEGNSVDSSAYYGIWFYGSTGGRCVNNTVRESSKTSAGTYANILLDTDGSIPSTNILVEGNSSSGSSFAKSAFEMTTGCTAIVNDNYFPVCAVNDIVIASGATASGSDITSSWTPALKFGGATTGITYITQRGTYLKEGRKVTCTLFIALSSKGSATGDAEIYGWPFNSVNQDAVIDLQINGVTFADVPQGYLATDRLQLQEVTNLGVVSNLTNADFSNASTIRATIVYFT